MHWLIKKFSNFESVEGDTISAGAQAQMNKGVVIWRTGIFGRNWALTGAFISGPLFAQLGTGAAVTVVTLLSAIAGTCGYTG